MGVIGNHITWGEILCKKFFSFALFQVSRGSVLQPSCLSLWHKIFCSWSVFHCGFELVCFPSVTSTLKVGLFFKINYLLKQDNTNYHIGTSSCLYDSYCLTFWLRNHWQFWGSFPCFLFLLFLSLLDRISMFVICRNDHKFWLKLVLIVNYLIVLVRELSLNGFKKKLNLFLHINKSNNKIRTLRKG